MMTENLAPFKKDIQNELQSILDFWTKYSVDEQYGGFIGKMDNNGIVYPEAEKGCVLNARILWTFSAAYNNYQNPVHYDLADRAFQYIHAHFLDPENGGVYWSVDFTGKPLNTRKQIYGLAFAIYGLSEFHQIGKNQEALDFAIELFELIEKYSYDTKNGGYKEAFSKDWQELEDLRLSEKDRNDPKTMNTHLHIIEAYVNLYKVWPQKRLKERIYELLEIFEHHIIDPDSFHLKLFFTEEWAGTSSAISYGHDIEASWLLLEAAKSVDDAFLVAKWEEIALKIADAAAKGLMPDGSLIHEYDLSTHHPDTHREWWVSAEAMVGYLNAYQISDDESYLKKVFGFWKFIQKHLLDQKQGEWFWGVYDDYSKMNEDKIGFWKCPYHNARACIEILKRI